MKSLRVSGEVYRPRRSALTHPDDAAFRVEARNMQLFHVKHPDVRREDGDFVIWLPAFHGKPGPG